MLMNVVLVSCALALQIPITNEVIFNGESFGKGSDMVGMMNQCFTGVYTGTGTVALAKGQTVKVVGPDVMVKLHMRGRCEGYNTYDYEVGKCGTGSGMDTPSDEFTADHPIQSYEIVQCKGGLKRSGAESVEEAAAKRAD
jgi:hypothetical protein